MREYNGQPRAAAGAVTSAEAAKGRVSGVREKTKRCRNGRKEKTDSRNTFEDRKRKTADAAEKRAEVWKNGQLRPDYTVYRFSAKEWAKYTGIYLALDACVSYLFFYSWLAFVLLLPGMILFFRDRRETLLRKRAQEIKRQFMDAMQLMTSSLQAGYSVENALREALRELGRVYDSDAFLIREFRMMDIQLAMSRSIEALFLDFGQRSGVDDIRSFAEVFVTAKRSGGDLVAVIRNTVSCIRQKQETMQEIETCLAGKVMEQNIMSMIPILILIYVKLTSPEFLSVMYRNPAGTVIMLLCFLVYVAAYFWGRSIVRIEV